MRNLLMALAGGLVGVLVAASAITGQPPETVPRAGMPSVSEFDPTHSESTPLAVTPPSPATTDADPGGLRTSDLSSPTLPGCQSGEPPSCKGACPPFNACQAIRLRSLEICNCVGERAVCGTADPLCGGVCPPGLVCAGDVFGFGSCRCDPPSPRVAPTIRRVPTTNPVTTTRLVTTTSLLTTTSLVPAAGLVTTTIPATTTTIPVTTTGQPPSACKASAYPGCGGECSPEEECIAYVDRMAVGNCRCFPAPPEGKRCGDADSPQCDGVCPSGTTCMGDEGAGGCMCFDVFGARCGFFGPPECAGECPAEALICREDGAGGCVCAP